MAKKLKISIKSKELNVDAIMPLKKGEAYIKKVKPQITNAKIITKEIEV